MIGWLLIIIILIGLFFAISLYIYDNSKFSKLTGYSYFNFLQDKEVRSHYNLVSNLQKVQGDYEVLLNVVLPTNNVKADVVFVHQSGIHIINFKRMTGWIYGREQDPEWAEVQYSEKLNKFDNPLIENKIAILELKQILGLADSTPIHSLVVFSDNCSFKKVEVQSRNTDVLKIKELKAYWNDSMDKHLSKDEIMKINLDLNKYVTLKKSPEKSKANSVVTN